MMTMHSLSTRLGFLVLCACTCVGVAAQALLPPANLRVDGVPASSPSPPPSGDYSPPGYQIVLSDEFNSGSLDRSKWCTRYIYGGGPALQVPDAQCTPGGQGTVDYFKDEQQRYRDYNTRGEAMHVVSGGTLKLRATKTNQDSYASYESAMIRSKYEFKPTGSTSYYITARVKLPNVLGTWPAMWLVGGLGTNNQIQWPPEIDIFEAATNNDGWPANSLRLGSQVKGAQTASRGHEFTFSVPEFDLRWHNYKPTRLLRDVWMEVGALWTATNVCYYVDGARIACENYMWADNSGVAANPAHFLLNLAIGGSWAGSSGIEDAKFPTQMEVDHVRIYRSP